MWCGGVTGSGDSTSRLTRFRHICDERVVLMVLVMAKPLLAVVMMVTVVTVMVAQQATLVNLCFRCTLTNVRFPALVVAITEAV